MSSKAVMQELLRWFGVVIVCIFCLAPGRPSLAQTGAPSDKSVPRPADHADVWGPMFQAQVGRCWKKPHASAEDPQAMAAFAIKLTRDGMLEGAPIPEKAPDTPYLRSLQESGLRAIVACQPYKLPAAYFEEWKNFAPVFTSSFPLVSSLYLPLSSHP
jgi:hypothetical protein